MCAHALPRDSCHYLLRCATTYLAVTKRGAIAASRGRAVARKTQRREERSRKGEKKGRCSRTPSIARQELRGESRPESQDVLLLRRLCCERACVVPITRLCRASKDRLEQAARPPCGAPSGPAVRASAARSTRSMPGARPRGARGPRRAPARCSSGGRWPTSHPTSTLQPRTKDPRRTRRADVQTWFHTPKGSPPHERCSPARRQRRAAWPPQRPVPRRTEREEAARERLCCPPRADRRSSRSACSTSALVRAPSRGRHSAASLFVFRVQSQHLQHPKVLRPASPSLDPSSQPSSTTIRSR